MTANLPDTASLRAIVQDVAPEMTDEVDRGKVADYIPQLAGVDPSGFALTLATAGGEVIAAGDADMQFSIQRTLLHISVKGIHCANPDG